jgi:hypothetical protein
MVQVLSKKTCSIHGARSYVPSICVIGHELIQPILCSSFMGRAACLQGKEAWISLGRVQFGNAW